MANTSTDRLPFSTKMLHNVRRLSALAQKSITPNVNTATSAAEWQTIYTSPFVSAVRTLKRISIASCAMACSATPFLYFLNDGPATIKLAAVSIGTNSSNECSNGRWQCSGPAWEARR